MSANDLRLFRVAEYLLIDTKQYGLPSSLGDKVYFIIFERSGLEDPNNDPIGIYYNGGIKYYLWRSRHWVGIDYDMKRIVDKAIELTLKREVHRDHLDILAKFSIYRATGDIETGSTSFPIYGTAAVKLCRSNLL